LLLLCYRLLLLLRHMYLKAISMRLPAPNHAFGS